MNKTQEAHPSIPGGTGLHNRCQAHGHCQQRSQEPSSLNGHIFVFHLESSLWLFSAPLDPTSLVVRSSGRETILFKEKLIDCFPCKGGEAGTCWREGVTYTLFCVECGEELAAYFGESGRNAFTRGKEHIGKYNAKDEDNSVLWLHSLHHHQGREDVPFSMKVTGGYPEPLDRQTMERS